MIEKTILEYNVDNVTELELYIVQSWKIYQNHTRPIIALIKSKKLPLEYALINWHSLAYIGAEKYIMEYSNRGDLAFSYGDLVEVAQRLADHYDEEINLVEQPKHSFLNYGANGAVNGLDQ